METARDSVHGDHAAIIDTAMESEMAVTGRAARASAGCRGSQPAYLSTLRLPLSSMPRHCHFSLVSVRYSVEDAIRLAGNGRSCNASSAIIPPMLEAPQALAAEQWT